MAANELEQKADTWKTWTEAARLTHYARADAFRKWNNAIGVAAVLLSTVVSAGILTSVHKNPGFGWTLAAAILGVAATALTGVRAYLKLGELSELHRVRAGEFGEIRRTLETFLLGNPPNDAASRAQLDRIADQIAKLEKKGPGYPGKVFKRKFDQVKQHGTEGQRPR